MRCQNQFKPDSKLNVISGEPSDKGVDETGIIAGGNESSGTGIQPKPAIMPVDSGEKLERGTALA